MAGLNEISFRLDLSRAFQGTQNTHIESLQSFISHWYCGGERHAKPQLTDGRQPLLSIVLWWGSVIKNNYYTRMIVICLNCNVKYAINK